MSFFSVFGAVGSLLPPLLIGFAGSLICLMYTPISEAPVTLRSVSLFAVLFMAAELIVAYWASATAYWYLLYEVPARYIIGTWIANVAMMTGGACAVFFVDLKERMAKAKLADSQ